MGCVERAPFAGCYKGLGVKGWDGLGCVEREPHLLAATRGWGLKVGMGCVERAPFAGCYKGLGVKGWDGLCREPHLLAATRSGGWDGLCRKSPICWLLQGVGG